MAMDVRNAGGPCSTTEDGCGSDDGEMAPDQGNTGTPPAGIGTVGEALLADAAQGSGNASLGRQDVSISETCVAVDVCRIRPSIAEEPTVLTVDTTVAGDAKPSCSVGSNVPMGRRALASALSRGLSQVGAVCLSSRRYRVW